MKKRVITNKEFIDKFVECLKERKDFRLENCIVEGDVDILDIYKKIKKKIKDKKRLEELIEERSGLLSKIIIDVDVYISNVKFNGEFRMHNYIIDFEIEIIAEFRKLADFGEVTFNKETYFRRVTFNEEAYFGGATFNGEVNFGGATFERTDFRKATFNEETNFWGATFKGKVNFEGVTFNGETNFIETTFNGKTDFREATFEKEAVFLNSTFNIARFYNSTFKSRADFTNISFNLLSFEYCIFEDLALFKKKEDKEDEENKECLAIFFNTQFLNKHTKIENFPLSKTSFLKTDVREVMILCNIKKEEILSHKLLKLKENTEGIYKFAYEILISDLDYKSVLAEYRNLRISIENNRTYIEASDLYKMEMELIKEFSKNDFERFAIWFYGFLSDYGESIKKPIIFMFGLIITTPLILTLSHYLNSFINAQISNKIPEFLLMYIKYLKDVLGAKFYIGNGKSSLLETIIFCLYSIFMMITTANLYIALRRKLSRK
ncbi:hypothetical protein JH146_0700 [Methanocaldococcus bathoardescens]|uniref:Pentapeptide repeat-containing protein n=1 Tax=Methanocaldococcus bathoardescens TaxID=1301915 RepID=A0A076LGI4_9EURY|nr:pentapeptide repeat-containing protein [Methanocaldococcus bathoardescens]AIJ05548.1 hypothetical protein JH146_0700 [Methanocaldococcus bathoardescens]